MNPDIGKCVGKDCERRDSCIRFTHPAKEKNQNWLFQRVAVPDTSKCRFYAESYECLMAV